jgi:hypothetical protein
LLLGLATAAAAMAADAPDKPAAAPAPEPKTGPLIACDQPVFDFGQRRNEAGVQYAFTVRNAGNEDLKITKIQTTCGCTTASAGNMTLAPGAKTSIDVKLDFKGRRGLQHKAIYVHSNDPHKPVLTLTMKGAIFRDVDVVPMQIMVMATVNDTNAVKDVMVYCSGEPLPRLTGLDTNDVPFCTFEVTEREARGEYSLRTVVDAKHLTKVTSLRGKLGLLFSSEAYPRLDVPVNVSIQNPISVMPSLLFMSAVSAGSGPVTRQLYVQSISDPKIEVLDVAVPDPAIKAEFKSLRKGLWRIKVNNLRVDQALHGKSIDITVRTGKGAEEILRVPIRIGGVRTVRPLPPVKP